MRLVIRQSVRDKALEAGIQAVFEANGNQELNYTVEAAIRVAVEKAIDTLEYDLA